MDCYTEIFFLIYWLVYTSPIQKFFRELGTVGGYLIFTELPFTEGVIVDGLRLEAKINQSFTKVKLLKIKGEKI